MGKKKSGSRGTAEVDEGVLREVDTLRSTAGAQYLKKDYAGALDAFDKAYKLLPGDCAQRWYSLSLLASFGFHCYKHWHTRAAGAAAREALSQKKAFCYMNLQK
jgi:hypothetical protein